MFIENNISKRILLPFKIAGNGTLLSENNFKM